MAAQQQPTDAADAADSADAAEPVPPLPRAAQVERRQRIITAATDLLEERELEKIQIRDVADRAGVALATTYRYFSSKDHLYAAAIVEWSSAFFKRVQTRRGNSGSTDEDRLRKMLHYTLRTLERWPQFIRAVMVLESSPDDNARAELEVFSRQYAAAMESCVQDLPPETAESVLMVVGGVYNTEVRWWARERTTIREVERHLEQTIDLIFGHLPAPPVRGV
jgi:AcrR family transcriptional regulator